VEKKKIDFEHHFLSLEERKCKCDERSTENFIDGGNVNRKVKIEGSDPTYKRVC